MAIQLEYDFIMLDLDSVNFMLGTIQKKRQSKALLVLDRIGGSLLLLCSQLYLGGSPFWGEIFLHVTSFLIQP